jgi:anti-sigma factor RsiW
MGENRPIGEDDLHAYIDGRLEADRAEQVEAYLAAQPKLAARVEAMAQDRATLREALRPVAESPVPPELRVAVLRARRRLVLPLPRAAAAAMLVFALGGVAGWLGRGDAVDVGVARVEAPMGDAVAAFRVFAGAAAMPVLMTPESARQAARALAVQLGQPVPVPDLQPVGFGLVGGHVLATDMGPAILLLYRDGEANVLTVYVRPRPRHGGPAGERLDDGVATRFWFRDGLGIAVSTDVRNRPRMPTEDALM